MDIDRISWLAGLIEGTGTWFFRANPVFQLTSKSEELIDRFCNYTGGYKDSPEHEVKYWTASLGGSAAIDFALEIIPYLSRYRQKQIAEVLMQTRMRRLSNYEQAELRKTMELYKDE